MVSTLRPSRSTLPQQVVAGVGDPEGALPEAHALRAREARDLEGAVRRAARPGSDRGAHCPGRVVEQHDAVVAGVGDGQQPRLLVVGELGGVAQAGRVQGRSAPPVRQRPAHEVAGGLVGPQQRLDGIGDLRAAALARDLERDAPARVDQDERRPGVHAVGAPRQQLRVGEHGVLDAEAAHGALDCGRRALVRELGRVHADHDQVVAEAPLELADLLEHVHAVDAGRRPEVEQHDTPPERGERDRPGSSDEGCALELRRRDAGAVCHPAKSTHPGALRAAGARFTRLGDGAPGHPP